MLNHSDKPIRTTSAMDWGDRWFAILRIVRLAINRGTAPFDLFHFSLWELLGWPKIGRTSHLPLWGLLDWPWIKEQSIWPVPFAIVRIVKIVRRAKDQENIPFAIMSVVRLAMDWGIANQTLGIQYGVFTLQPSLFSVIPSVCLFSQTILECIIFTVS